MNKLIIALLKLFSLCIYVLRSRTLLLNEVKQFKGNFIAKYLQMYKKNKGLPLFFIQGIRVKSIKYSYSFFAHARLFSSPSQKRVPQKNRYILNTT